MPIGGGLVHCIVLEELQAGNTIPITLNSMNKRTILAFLIFSSPKGKLYISYVANTIIDNWWGNVKCIWFCFLIEWSKIHIRDGTTSYQDCPSSE